MPLAFYEILEIYKQVSSNIPQGYGWPSKT